MNKWLTTILWMIGEVVLFVVLREVFSVAYLLARKLTGGEKAEQDWQRFVETFVKKPKVEHSPDPDIYLMFGNEQGE